MMQGTCATGPTRSNRFSQSSNQATNKHDKLNRSLSNIPPTQVNNIIHYMIRDITSDWNMIIHDDRMDPATPFWTLTNNLFHEYSCCSTDFLNRIQGTSCRRTSRC